MLVILKNKTIFVYNANGTIIYVNTEEVKINGQIAEKAQEKKFIWDEENRLGAVDINGYVSNYTYDAGGERVTKLSGGGQGIFVNSVFAGGKTSTSDFTLYVNPYLVAQNGGRYTKHIYIGSQRIVSKLGDFDSYGADPRRVEKAGESFSGVKVNYDAKYKKSLEVVKANYDTFEVPYYGNDNNDYVNGLGFCCNPSGESASGSSSSTTGKLMAGKNDNAELQQFYYHPDHLGSSSYISNLDGEVVQHVEYVPFGEVFLEEKNAKWNTPYLFNAKELDRETGLYYYGARYYDSKLSLWASVDPLAVYNPVLESEFYFNGDHNEGMYNSQNLNTYGYCYQNPVALIDPNGKQTKVTEMSYTSLKSNLDRNGEAILKREKSLNYLVNKGTNTCAIVLSNTFNKSGYPIPKSKELPNNVRVQNGKKQDSGNFVLDAESMANYLKKIKKPTETYTIKTEAGVDKMIKDLQNKYDDLRGIIIYVADDKSKDTGYGATGHADLIYEDWFWDLSFGSGTDVKPYLKEKVLPKSTFKAYFWILDYDK